MMRNSFFGVALAVGLLSAGGAMAMELPTYCTTSGEGLWDIEITAGPCAVESEEQIQTTAEEVRRAGATMLRGGAYKPRTSPHSFQGLGPEGLILMRAAADEHDLAMVTEVLDPRQVDEVAAIADMVQVGSRNMQNLPLLKEVGGCGKPVLLKRGASATILEFLGAADHIRAGGNEEIVLCERGLRSFDPTTRYLLDLAAVPVLKGRSSLPVIVDPSHGTGRADLVAPMGRAAVAVGADGLLIEVHPNPENALSDGHQALTPADFSALMVEIRQWNRLSGRYLAPIGETTAL